MACISAPPPTLLSNPCGSVKPARLSWASSFPKLGISFNCITAPSRKGFKVLVFVSQDSFIRAAWTRRSRGEAAKRPNRKSWSQRTDMYMRPFLLDVFFSKRFIHAKVMHRGTSKVISVASTNSKDLRYSLTSLVDNDACRVIGNLIAERCKDADVFAMSFEPKKNERIEGRLGIVLDTIRENGIMFV
ncbi:hypothetical protein GBA52_007921 [Prunus armeniaca]|nr:hypothetical protein GBA52_007921 [Prunus armeniaca]